MASAAAAALAAAGWYAIGSAKAADKSGIAGGLADVEERVAELEATVARKGTRRITLTISGVVHKGVLWHNNDELPGKGKLSIYDGTTDPSRVRIAGEAKVGSTMAAGFVIEIAYAGDSARGIDTGKALFSLGNGTDGTNEFQIGDRGTVTRHSFVYLNGPLGKVSLGQQSMATDGIIEVNLANTMVAGKPLDTAPMNMGGAAAGLAIAYDGYRANAVRYDTPTISGFMASVAWSDSESWDAAIRWAGEFSGVRLAFGLGYRDQKTETLLNLINVLDVLTLDLAGSHKAVSGSASIKHMASGLFATAWYSRVRYEVSGTLGILPPLFSVSFPIGSETMTGYGGQVGIEKNFFNVGNTTIFVEYQKSNGEFLADVTSYGAGVVQSFDLLGLDLYLAARRYDVSSSGACLGICKETDVVSGGARIRF